MADDTTHKVGSESQADPETLMLGYGYDPGASPRAR
jgi:hypothetical protein